jgi:hypothetical protein
MSRRLVSFFLVALLLTTPFTGGGRGAADDSEQVPFDSPLGETNEEIDDDGDGMAGIDQWVSPSERAH